MPFGIRTFRGSATGRNATIARPRHGRGGLFAEEWKSARLRLRFLPGTLSIRAACLANRLTAGFRPCLVLTVGFLIMLFAVPEDFSGVKRFSIERGLARVTEAGLERQLSIQVGNFLQAT